MTPDEKALIDAKREGYVLGKRSFILEPLKEEIAEWTEEAALLFPYPTTRRVIRFPARKVSYRVAEDGEHLEALNDGDRDWHDHYLFDRGLIAALHALFENPNEEDFGDSNGPWIARRYYNSKSRKGLTHLVQGFSDGSVTCDCEGFKFNKYCWHVTDFRENANWP